MLFTTLAFAGADAQFQIAAQNALVVEANDVVRGVERHTGIEVLQRFFVVAFAHIGIGTCGIEVGFGANLVVLPIQLEGGGAVCNGIVVFFAVVVKRGAVVIGRPAWL